MEHEYRSLTHTQDRLAGLFYIEFAGSTEPRRVKIHEVIITGDGHILYLVGEGGVIYNWYTVISMTKIKES